VCAARFGGATEYERLLADTLLSAEQALTGS
jgi:hypothetical protein